MHHTVFCCGNESPGWVGPCSVRLRHAEHVRLHPKMAANMTIVFLCPARVSVFQHVTLRINGNCMGDFKIYFTY